MILEPIPRTCFIAKYCSSPIPSPITPRYRSTMPDPKNRANTFKGVVASSKALGRGLCIAKDIADHNLMSIQEVARRETTSNTTSIFNFATLYSV